MEENYNQRIDDLILNSCTSMKNTLNNFEVPNFFNNDYYMYLNSLINTYNQSKKELIKKIDVIPSCQSRITELLKFVEEGVDKKGFGKEININLKDRYDDILFATDTCDTTVTIGKNQKINIKTENIEDIIYNLLVLKKNLKNTIENVVTASQYLEKDFKINCGAIYREINNKVKLGVDDVVRANNVIAKINDSFVKCSTCLSELEKKIRCCKSKVTSLIKFYTTALNGLQKFSKVQKKQLCDQMIAGAFGNGRETRKKRFMEMGYTVKQYNIIQAAVNKRLNKKTKTSNNDKSTNSNTSKKTETKVPQNKNSNKTTKSTKTQKTIKKQDKLLKKYSKQLKELTAENKAAQKIIKKYKNVQRSSEKRYNEIIDDKEKQIQTEKANSQKAQEEIKNSYEQKITETNNKVDELTNKVNTLEQDKTNLVNENNNLQQEINNKSNERQFTQSSSTNTSDNNTWTKQESTVQPASEPEKTVSTNQSSNISDNSSTNNVTTSDTTTSIDDTDTTTDVDDTENTVVIEDDSDTSNSSSTSKGGSSPIPAILGVTAAGAATVAGVRYIKNKNKSNEYDNDDDDGAFEDDFDNNNDDDSGNDDTTYAYQAPQKEVSSEKYRAGSINKLVLDDSSDINISDSYDDDNEDEELE